MWQNTAKCQSFNYFGFANGTEIGNGSKAGWIWWIKIMAFKNMQKLQRKIFRMKAEKSAALHRTVRVHRSLSTATPAHQHSCWLTTFSRGYDFAEKCNRISARPKRIIFSDNDGRPLNSIFVGRTTLMTKFALYEWKPKPSTQYNSKTTYAVLKKRRNTFIAKSSSHDSADDTTSSLADAGDVNTWVVVVFDDVINGNCWPTPVASPEHAQVRHYK